ncbi:hypothetical protein ACOME3_004455 [Neoechinorhynchus agilis]
MVDYEFMKGKSNCNSFDLKKSWENCSQIKKIEVHELSKLLKNKRFNDESNYIHFYMGKSPIDGVIHIPSKKIESNSFSMGKTSSNALLAQQLKFQLKNGKSLSETDHYYEDFKLPNNEIELTLVDIDQCVVECVKKALRRNNFDDVDTCISAFLNKMILNRVDSKNAIFWQIVNQLSQNTRSKIFTSWFQHQEGLDSNRPNNEFIQNEEAEFVKQCRVIFKEKQKQAFEAAKSTSISNYGMHFIMGYPAISAFRLKSVRSFNWITGKIIAIYSMMETDTEISVIIAEKAKNLRKGLRRYFPEEVATSNLVKSKDCTRTHELLKALLNSLYTQFESILERKSDSKKKLKENMLNTLLMKHKQMEKHLCILQEVKGLKTVANFTWNFLTDLLLDINSPLYSNKIKDAKQNEYDVYNILSSCLSKGLKTTASEFKGAKFKDLISYLRKAEQNHRFISVDFFNEDGVCKDQCTLSEFRSAVKQRKIERQRENLKNLYRNKGLVDTNLQMKDREIKELEKIRDELELIRNRIEERVGFTRNDSHEKMSGGDLLVVWNLGENEIPIAQWNSDGKIFNICFGKGKKNLLAIATSAGNIHIMLLTEKGFQKRFEIRKLSDKEVFAEIKIADMQFEIDDLTHTETLIVATNDGNITRYRSLENYCRWELIVGPTTRNIEMILQENQDFINVINPKDFANRTSKKKINNFVILFPHGIKRYLKVSNISEIRLCAFDGKLLVEYYSLRVPIKSIVISKVNPRLFAILHTNNLVEFFLVDESLPIHQIYVVDAFNISWSSKIQSCLYVFTSRGIIVIHVGNCVRITKIDLLLQLPTFKGGEVLSEDNMVLLMNKREEFELFAFVQPQENFEKPIYEHRKQKWYKNQEDVLKLFDLLLNQSQDSEADMVAKQKTTIFVKYYPQDEVKSKVKQLLKESGSNTSTSIIDDHADLSNKEKLVVFKVTLDNLRKANISSPSLKRRLLEWSTWLKADRWREINCKDNEAVEMEPEIDKGKAVECDGILDSFMFKKINNDLTETITEPDDLVDFLARECELELNNERAQYYRNKYYRYQTENIDEHLEIMDRVKNKYIGNVNEQAALSSGHKHPKRLSGIKDEIDLFAHRDGHRSINYAINESAMPNRNTMIEGNQDALTSSSRKGILKGLVANEKVPPSTKFKQQILNEYRMRDATERSERKSEEYKKDMRNRERLMFNPFAKKRHYNVDVLRSFAGRCIAEANALFFENKEGLCEFETELKIREKRITTRENEDLKNMETSRYLRDIRNFIILMHKHNQDDVSTDYDKTNVMTKIKQQYGEI